MDNDERFLKKAISLAKKGLGSTFPNPAVGAVLVKNGQIISTGYHKMAGGPHAEAEALNKAAGKAEGATMYVNLEPCNHYGRTPPCTKALVKSGVKRVIIGIRDPNPDVAGGGADYLRSKGIDVRCGVLERECARLNEVYIKNVTEHKSFVSVKAALTLDGWIAAKKRNSKWITNEKSRKFVHILRRRADAIMVGVNTVIADNPVLQPYLVRKTMPDPVRVILDTHLRIPIKRRVFDSKTAPLTIIATGSIIDKKKEDYVKMLGAKILKCDLKDGRIDLEDLLEKLSNMSIWSVLVEGGAALYRSIIRNGHADKFYLFFAPKILGGDDGVPFIEGPGFHEIKDCLQLNIHRVRRFLDDIMIEAYPKKS